MTRSLMALSHGPGLPATGTEEVERTESKRSHKGDKAQYAQHYTVTKFAAVTGYILHLPYSSRDRWVAVREPGTTTQTLAGMALWTVATEAVGTSAAGLLSHMK